MNVVTLMRVSPNKVTLKNGGKRRRMIFLRTLAKIEKDDGKGTK